MSSLTVRQAFEAEWPVRMPDLDLNNTINVEPDRSVLPDNWATVDYQPTDYTQISLGGVGCWRETGSILVTVFTLPGLGDTQAVTLGEEVRSAFRKWRDDVNDIRIITADPPDGGEASDGRWFAASVSLAYQYDQLI